jgi:hypothetical protein
VPLRKTSRIIGGALQPPCKIGARSFNLGRTWRLTRQATERLRHELQRFGDATRIRATRDHQRAGILIVNRARTDVVDEPTLFAHLQEETARRAIAKDRGEHLKCGGVWIFATKRRQSYRELRLLTVTHLCNDPILSSTTRLHDATRR